jgi:hypothetical protein
MAHLSCIPHFFSTAPENLVETQAAIIELASAELNIELAHTLEEIIEGTYLGKAFYLHSPDVEPFADGFIAVENCTITDYLCDIDGAAEEPGAISFIATHGAGDTLTVLIVSQT